MAFANRPKAKGAGRRDFGLRGSGAGKGDVSRVTDVETYRARFPKLDGNVQGFVKKGTRFVKRYGAAQQLEVEVEDARPDPGPGYRLLDRGEILKDGDEIWWGNSRWEKSLITGFTVHCAFFRRKL